MRTDSFCCEEFPASPLMSAPVNQPIFFYLSFLLYLYIVPNVKYGGSSHHKKLGALSVTKMSFSFIPWTDVKFSQHQQINSWNLIINVKVLGLWSKCCLFIFETKSMLVLNLYLQPQQGLVHIQRLVPKILSGNTFKKNISIRSGL